MSAENVKFGSCSLESDRFIVVCENAQQQIAIIDLKEGNTCVRQKMSAEAAIMHPVQKIIALRGESPSASSALPLTVPQPDSSCRYSTWRLGPS